jgi:hypothetical protein
MARKPKTILFFERREYLLWNLQKKKTTGLHQLLKEENGAVSSWDDNKCSVLWDAVASGRRGDQLCIRRQERLRKNRASSPPACKQIRRARQPPLDLHVRQSPVLHPPATGAAELDRPARAAAGLSCNFSRSSAPVSGAFTCRAQARNQQRLHGLLPAYCHGQFDIIFR